MSKRAPTLDELEPSSDFDAEAAVVSAAILDPEAMPRIIDFLRDEHFRSEAHRRIFEACCALFGASTPIDPTTVASWLRERDRLGQVGGVAGIMAILDASPAPTNIRSHAVKVHDAWRRREVMLAAKRLVAQSSQGNEAAADVQGWTETIVRRFGDIALLNPVHPVESNDQVCDRIIASAFATSPAPLARGEVPMDGLPTGLYGLDRLLGGLRKSAKTTICAGTGGGKSALAIQLAVHLAAQGAGVFMASKEMKRHEVLQRAILQVAQVSANRVKQRTLREQDRKALLEAAERVKKLPLIIDDSPRLTIEELSAATRAAKETMLLRHRVPLVMVIDDNVNRSEPSRHLLQKERHIQLEHHTKNFKILVAEENLIGLELAQMKEAPAGKKPEKPRGNTAVADSSKIGKEADDLIYLWEVNPATPHDPRSEVLAIIAKQRNGAKGEVTLMFRGDMFWFSDPNDPTVWTTPSRQYVDQTPERTPEPPAGFFDDFTRADAPGAP